MINERDEYIRTKDYDSLMDWAYKHDSASMSRDVLEDVAEAYELLIDEGYGIAANNLGSMYYCGRYFHRNVDKAIGYYEKAMENSTQIAWGNLGCCYYYDKKDYRKAYEVFSEGASLFNDAECLYMLGDMYRFGYYVDASDVKAFHLYERALEAANSDNVRDYAMQGDIHCRMGEMMIDKADSKDVLTAGLKNLHIGIGIMYDRYNENRFVDKDIRKFRKLIRDTEKLLDAIGNQIGF